METIGSGYCDAGQCNTNGFFSNEVENFRKAYTKHCLENIASKSLQQTFYLNNRNVHFPQIPHTILLDMLTFT